MYRGISIPQHFGLKKVYSVHRAAGHESGGDWYLCNDPETIKKIPLPQSQSAGAYFTTNFKEGYAFQNCGAGMIWGLGGGISSYEPTQQNIALCLYHILNSWCTYYCIPASYQIRGNSMFNRSSEKTILDLLVEFGAKEIDVRPNKNHGPYNMHMMVIPNSPSADLFKNYIYFEKEESQYRPLWYATLTKDEKQQIGDFWRQIDATLADASKQQQVRDRDDRHRQSIDTVNTLIYYLQNGAKTEQLEKVVSIKNLERLKTYLKAQGYERIEPKVPSAGNVGSAQSAVWQAQKFSTK